MTWRWYYLPLCLALALPACGGSEEDYGPDEPEDTTPEPIENKGPILPPTRLDCPKGTYLTYENFGEAFMLNYCTSCHSQHVPTEKRALAPEAANFDTSRDVLYWRQAIMARTILKVPRAMPPSAQISAADLAAFKEWMNCGAPAGASHMKP